MTPDVTLPQPKPAARAAVSMSVALRPLGSDVLARMLDQGPANDVIVFDDDYIAGLRRPRIAQLKSEIAAKAARAAASGGAQPPRGPADEPVIETPSVSALAFKLRRAAFGAGAPDSDQPR